MRAVRFSITARDQLAQLLAQGVPKYGPAMVAQKRDLVFEVIDNFLVHHPRAKQPDPKLGLVVYPISNTPFAVLYEFDDLELRIHFIVPASSHLTEIDPLSAEW